MVNLRYQKFDFPKVRWDNLKVKLLCNSKVSNLIIISDYKQDIAEQFTLSSHTPCAWNFILKFYTMLLAEI